VGYARVLRYANISHSRSGKETLFQAEPRLEGETRRLVLGECVTLEKPGEEGMGQVFKARHRSMERRVALKVLPARRESGVRAPDATADWALTALEPMLKIE